VSGQSSGGGGGGGARLVLVLYVYTLSRKKLTSFVCVVYGGSGLNLLALLRSLLRYSIL